MYGWKVFSINEFEFEKLTKDQKRSHIEQMLAGAKTETK